MNGVDRANQLRRNLTAHRACERRVWRPLWYYVLDVCAVNSHLIWKGDTEDKSKKGQRPFRNVLEEALLNTPYATSNHGNYRAMPSINEKAHNHHREQFLDGDIVFGARSKQRRPKQGLYWLKLSMELLLRGANFQRGAEGALQAVMYISVKKKPVSNTTIVIIIINSSLLPIPPCYLAPRIIDANFRCHFGLVTGGIAVSQEL
jgi:hypothetical protein